MPWHASASGSIGVLPGLPAAPHAPTWERQISPHGAAPSLAVRPDAFAARQVPAPIGLGTRAVLHGQRPDRLLSVLLQTRFANKPFPMPDPNWQCPSTDLQRKALTSDSRLLPNQLVYRGYLLGVRMKYVLPSRNWIWPLAASISTSSLCIVILPLGRPGC